MRAPSHEFYGHTWVGWLNFLLLRWFFIRLAYERPFEDACNNAKPLHDHDVDKANIIIMTPNIFNVIKNYTEWSIIFRCPWRW